MGVQVRAWCEDLEKGRDVRADGDRMSREVFVVPAGSSVSGACGRDSVSAPELGVMPGPRVAASTSALGALWCVVCAPEDSDDGLAFAQSGQLLGVPTCGDEVDGGRAAEEEAVMQDEMSRHGHGFRVGHPVRPRSGTHVHKSARAAHLSASSMSPSAWARFRVIRLMPIPSTTVST